MTSVSLQRSFNIFLLSSDSSSLSHHAVIDYLYDVSARSGPSTDSLYTPQTLYTPATSSVSQQMSDGGLKRRTDGIWDLGKCFSYNYSTYLLTTAFLGWPLMTTTMTTNDGLLATTTANDAQIAQMIWVIGKFSLLLLTTILLYTNYTFFLGRQQPWQQMTGGCGLAMTTANDARQHGWPRQCELHRLGLW